MQALDVLEITAAGNAPVVDEQPRFQAVGRKERDQSCKVRAVMAFRQRPCETRECLPAGSRPDPLDQGAALDLIFVVPDLPSGTMSAIQVGVGHIS